MSTATRWRFRYEGGPATVELAVTAAGGDALAELSRTIEREFDRPFAPGRHENPFRFVAIDEGDAFQLALAYDHYVASGDSIARLLSGMACTYLGAGERPMPMERYSPTYRNLFLRHPLWVMRSILGLVRMVATARRAYRVQLRQGRGRPQRIHLPAARAAAARRAARARRRPGASRSTSS